MNKALEVKLTKCMLQLKMYSSHILDMFGNAVLCFEFRSRNFYEALQQSLAFSKELPLAGAGFALHFEVKNAEVAQQE